MGFDLSTVESLAPDQASLTAASKLAKTSKWVTLNREGNLWWGECQGSGANPYRAVIDTQVVGYKCTCPSRKFPCKHALALMWLAAQEPDAFAPGTTPQWISEWLGRRRTNANTVAANSDASKSIHAAEAGAKEVEEDKAALAKKEAAARKRRENTLALIADALDDTDQWVSDQLKVGLSAFIDTAPERCRTIAARLVDNKAAALASRIDELPARLHALPSEERPDAAIRELGKLVLLAKAWRVNPEDPDTARAVGAAERRDDILAHPAAIQVTGHWEVVGEQIQNRRDGLVSHSTWFLNLSSKGPRFALLLDFYPASTGRPGSVFNIGAQYEATMAYYPSRVPLRALATAMTECPADTTWPVADVSDPLSPMIEATGHIPWQLEFPLLLGPGRFASSADNWWWQSETGVSLPLASETKKMGKALLGVQMNSAAGIWDGARLTILSACTPLGRAIL